MRKSAIFLFLCFFAVSLAYARSIDISIDKTELNASSNLTIDYRIYLDEEENFTYQLGVKGEDQIVLFNKTLTGNGDSGTFIWNTENYPAGKYEAYLFIYPATYWPSRKFEILPFMNFELGFQKLDMFAYKKTASKDFEIKNTGNVPIFVSLSLTGLKSESSLTPMTADVLVNSSGKFAFVVGKPDENYNAVMTLEASWTNISNKLEIPVNVYNPIVVIEAENLTLEKTDVVQVIKGAIYNKGNVYRELTLIYDLKDGKQNETVILESNQTFELNKSFGLEQKVNSMQIKYIASDGNEKTITKSFGLLPSFSLDFLDNLKGKTYYLAIALAVLIAILYVIYKSKRRTGAPVEKAQ